MDNVSDETRNQYINLVEKIFKLLPDEYSAEDVWNSTENYADSTRLKALVAFIRWRKHNGEPVGDFLKFYKKKAREYNDNIVRTDVGTPEWRHVMDNAAKWLAMPQLDGKRSDAAKLRYYLVAHFFSKFPLRSSEAFNTILIPDFRGDEPQTVNVLNKRGELYVYAHKNLDRDSEIFVKKLPADLNRIIWDAHAIAAANGVINDADNSEWLFFKRFFPAEMGAAILKVFGYGNRLIRRSFVTFVVSRMNRDERRHWADVLGHSLRTQLLTYDTSEPL